MMVRPLIDAPERAGKAGWRYVHPTWQRRATRAEMALYGVGDGLCYALTAEDACRHDRLDND